MTQPQRQQAAETILEKKTANKYEKEPLSRQLQIWSNKSERQ